MSGRAGVPSPVNTKPHSQIAVAYELELFSCCDAASRPPQASGAAKRRVLCTLWPGYTQLSLKIG